LPQIFISYRRADGIATVGRLYDRLIHRYGEKSIFWDLDVIPPGRDFREEIHRHLATSDVILVVISPEWLGEIEGVGSRVLDENDYVRIEIETALVLKCCLIPLLILGARMPRSDKIPQSIEGVLYCNAVELGDGKAFNQGYEELICAVDRLVASRRRPLPAPLAPTSSYRTVDPSLAAMASLLDLSKRKEATQSVRRVETLSDLRYIWEIDNNAYGDANVSFEIYSSWWLSYRGGLYALYADERPVGAIGLWPVPGEWLMAFRAGAARESDLLADQIAVAGSRPTSTWYVSGVVLDPAWQHTNAIGTLLRETTLSWAVECDLVFPINLSAMAISDAGEKLLARYGFKLATPSFKMKDGFSFYERTLERRDLKLLGCS
jgi:TIR domain